MREFAFLDPVNGANRRQMSWKFCAFLVLVMLMCSCDATTTASCDVPSKSSAASDFEELERCLIMIKPDGVQRGLVGEIVRRFEAKGFQLMALKMVNADTGTLHSHYEEHANRPFFNGLIEFMKSGPVVPMVWQGDNIVKIARSMLGATDPVNSLPGTIRGDFGTSKQKNLCHVSDSVESAQREIELWFTDSELLRWNAQLNSWKFG